MGAFRFKYLAVVPKVVESHDRGKEAKSVMAEAEPNFLCEGGILFARLVVVQNVAGRVERSIWRHVLGGTNLLAITRG